MEDSETYLVEFRADETIIVNGQEVEAAIVSFYVDNSVHWTFQGKENLRSFMTDLLKAKQMLLLAGDTEDDTGTYRDD